MHRSLALILLWGAAALGQLPNSTLPSPRLACVYPCGGRIGQSFDVIVKGTDLDDPTGLRFSHPGLTAEGMREPAPKKDAPPRPHRFKVRVAKDVPPGTHEVRVVGRHGVSNPRAFVIDKRPELLESEPNSDVPQAQKVEIGSVVHGVIEASTDVDYFTFTGKQGQRVLVHCAAGSIDSRARPFVECYAADGRTRLAFNSNDRGTDALCDVTLPADGDFFLRVSEFAYTAGGPDYFYRLTIGTGPWLDAIDPPMIEAGESGEFRLVGRMLDGQSSVRITAPPRQGFSGLALLPQASGLLDGFFTSPRGLNPLPLFFAEGPVVRESVGENDTAAKAQSVTVPCEIAGRMEIRNDRDCYSFSARRGEPLMVELFAERIGTRLDAILSVKGPDGRELIPEPQQDDDPETLHPTAFFTRTTDPPPFRLVPPADGTYTVTVAANDSNVNFGPRAIYRLRLTPPRPDFRTLVMPRNRDFPSGVTVLPNSDAAIDVFLQRIDGFTGSVSVTASNLPPGVTASTAVIGTGQKWGLIILRGAKELKNSEADVTVTATATIDGKTVSHPAQSASIIWPVPNAPGSPTLARLDHGLIIATRTEPRLPILLKAKLDKATIKGSDGKERPAPLPLTARPGERISFPVEVLWQGEGARPNAVNVAAEPTLSLQGAAALTVNNSQPLAIPKDKTDAVVTIEVRNNTPPGEHAVYLRADSRVNIPTDAASKAKRELTVLAFAAPVPVTVLPPAKSPSR